MEKQYLTVTALTRYIKTKIEYDPHLQSVWLKGGGPSPAKEKKKKIICMATKKSRVCVCE